ncbi:MAG: 50S ribosomal protein L10 [Olegusella sp.]|nr:50S ribosomal protein L10 [Olegusella sp.]
MPAQSKKEMYAKIATDIESSKGVFVIDYRGLTVKEAQELRRSLTAVGAHMKVYKNNIVRIALSEAGMPDISSALAGPCAYIFYENDPVDAAKALKAAFDKFGKIELLGAIADGKALDAESAKAYAELPSHDELIAKFVYVLASPLTGVARVTAAPLQGLATALEAIADQKNAA